MITSNSTPISRMACVVLWLAIASSTIPSASASPGNQDPGRPNTLGPTDQRAAVSGQLRIEINPTVDDAELLREWIASRNADIAEKVPVLPGHEQWVTVEIGGVTYDYTVSVVAMRDGKPMGDVVEPLGCECTTDRLLAIVDTRIDIATDELKQPLRAAKRTPKSPESNRRDEAEPDRPVRELETDRTRSRRLGVRGKTGVAFFVLGAGAVGAGVPLWLRPGTPEDTGTELIERYTMPPGIALTAAGGAAVVLGTALLISDAVHRRKRAVVMVPTVRSQQAGLSLTGRF